MAKRKAKAHDLNSPSRLAQRRSCPGSANAERGLKDVPNKYAEEGTRQHELFKAYLDAVTQGNPTPKVTAKDADILGEIITMVERIGIYDGDVVLTEQHVDLSHLGITDGGTIDLIIIRASGEIIVADLKTGRSIVDVNGNWQLLAYLSGVVTAQRHVREIGKLTVAILQPCAGVSMCEVSADELAIAEDDIRDTIEATKSPVAQRIAGTHCKWCLARGTCKATEEASAEIERIDPAALSIDDTLRAMTDQQAALFFARVAAVEARLDLITTARNRLILAGELTVDGCRVMNGKRTYGWTPDAEGTLVEVATAAGVEPEQFFTMVSVAQAKKLLPKYAHAQLAAVVTEKISDPYVMKG
jgi:hypothetical protein